MDEQQINSGFEVTMKDPLSPEYRNLQQLRKDVVAGHKNLRREGKRWLAKLFGGEFAQYVRGVAMDPHDVQRVKQEIGGAKEAKEVVGHLLLLGGTVDAEKHYLGARKWLERTMAARRARYEADPSNTNKADYYLAIFAHHEANAFWEAGNFSNAIYKELRKGAENSLERTSAQTPALREYLTQIYLADIKRANPGVPRELTADPRPTRARAILAAKHIQACYDLDYARELVAQDLADARVAKAATRGGPYEVVMAGRLRVVHQTAVGLGIERGTK